MHARVTTQARAVVAQLHLFSRAEIEAFFVSNENIVCFVLYLGEARTYGIAYDRSNETRIFSAKIPPVDKYRGNPCHGSAILSR